MYTPAVVTLADLAARLGCPVEGDGSIEVVRVAALDAAGPGDLTFLSNPKYASRLPATRASAAIVGEGVTGAPCAVLRSRNPYATLAEALDLLTPPRRPARTISPLAAIDPAALVGPDVSIGAFASIAAGVRLGARTIIYPHVVIDAETTVGEDCVIHAHVSIRDAVTIGDRVVIQDAAVIGSDGFGFARRADGTHRKIPQVGGVVIEDDVEIGAQSAVDRPAIGQTRILRGTKIDNLVQIAHGVTLGQHVLLAAQVGIAGSTTLGDGVVMAGQSGAAGHLHLGAGVKVNAKSAVTTDIDAGAHVAGIPAGDVVAWRKATVIARRLPELRRAMADLDARIAAIEARLMT
jgi:UDP-3-O-[3-hydroxymyristoyl] glucosamine N-acyltransferase